MNGNSIVNLNNLNGYSFKNGLKFRKSLNNTV